MLTYLMRMYIEDPMRSVKHIQLIMNICCLIIAALEVNLLDSNFTIGFSKPASCWIKSDEMEKKSFYDEMIQLWIVLLIPFMVYNIWAMRKQEKGWIAKVLNTYMDRTEKYVALTILTIVFDNYVVLVDLYVDDFRSNRPMQFIHLLLNLW